MARLSPLEPSSPDPAVQALFDDFLRERGAVPNMFRTLAYDPELLKTWFTMFRTTMREGSVSVRLKEILAVRVSKLNSCRY
jgi:hypothetical protein